MKNKKYKNVVVGAGITGITIAERLASRGEEVLIIEKRDHIGGNCYDYFDKNGNYIQRYGPHAFHTKDKEVWDYLSNFTEWQDYEHKVLAYIEGKLVPIPFNLNSIEKCFSKEEAEKMKKKLIEIFGKGKNVPILELKKEEDKLIKKLADYVYEKVFLHYTMKQWDLKPEEIDPSVTARVPVSISRDNRYFQDKYQEMPKEGFTEMFKNMLSDPKIKLRLETDFKDVEEDYDYERLFYTGPIDEFFNYEYGKVKYRNAKWRFEKHKTRSYQKTTQVNYPNIKSFTRVTEFNKYLNLENCPTVIAKEFPSWNKGYSAWPVKTDKNNKKIKKYKDQIEKLKDIFFVGRLAESKYYNIDEAVKRGMELIKNVK